MGRTRFFLESMGNPVFMLTGQAPAGTTEVALRYADGTTATTRPLRGYVVYAIPAAHLSARHRLTRATALASNGKQLATQAFPVRPAKR